VGDVQYIPVESPPTVGKFSCLVGVSRRFLEILALYNGKLERRAHFYDVRYHLPVDS